MTTMAVPEYLTARIRGLMQQRAQLVQQVTQIDGALAELQSLADKLTASEPAPTPTPAPTPNRKARRAGNG